MSRPNISLENQRADIRPPCVSGPSQDLLHESPIVFESGPKLCFRTALHVSPPLVRVHPARYELVISRMLVILANPVLMCKFILEIGVSQDVCSVRGCSPRQAANSAVDVRRTRDFQVAHRYTECCQYLPDCKLCIIANYRL